MAKKDKVQFTEEEVTELKTISANYVNLQQTLGQVSVQRLLLQRQLDGLDATEQETQDSYVKNQQDEQTSLAKLQEKYGEGSYDTKNNTISCKFKQMFTTALTDLDYNVILDYGTVVEPTIMG